MTVLYGDTGIVNTGPLKTFTLTMAAIRETLLPAGSEIALPTGTEPAAATPSCISYTIQASDLPVVSPSAYSMKYTPFLVCSGKNTGVGSAIVKYSVYKNGVAVVTNQAGTAITVNNFWTQTHYRWLDVQVGDVIEVRCWADIAGVNLDYFNLVVYATRIELTQALYVLDLEVPISNGNGMPTMATLGKPAVGNTGGWALVAFPESGGYAAHGFSSTASYAVLSISNNYGIFAGRPAVGDISQTSVTLQHATNHPFYNRTAFPTSFSFYEAYL